MNIMEVLGVDQDDPALELARRLVRGDEDLLDDLVRIRRMHGLTQEKVGETMGVTQSAVARIESGERDPRLSTLRRYALAINAEVTHTVSPARPRTARNAILSQTADEWEQRWAPSEAVSAGRLR